LKPDPYRIFFPLGVLLGLAGVSTWPLYAFGVTAGYSGRAHALVQTNGFLLAFVAGFLLTAVPRFTGTETPSRPTQICLAAILIVSAAASELQAFGIATAAALLAHALMLALVARRFVHRRQPPPPTFVLIGLGLASGALAAVLNCGVAWEILPAFWDLLGKRLVTEGMMLLLVLGVGGFLGQRLLGVSPVALPPGRQERLWAAAGSAILISLIAEYGVGLEWMAFVRAAVVTAVIFGTLHIWRRPAIRSTLSWCVWTAEWLTVVSVWLVAAAPRYRADFLHVLFIGGFSLLIFAVGTRVTLSHGSHDLGAERRSWPLRLGLAMGLIALLARAGAPFAQATYFDHLAFAALFWMGGTICWGAYITTMIRRSRA
jgi:uncharacterized protein involved in response to NO